jgi:hypothetical protein
MLYPVFNSACIVACTREHVTTSRLRSLTIMTVMMMMTVTSPHGLNSRLCVMMLKAFVIKMCYTLWLLNV